MRTVASLTVGHRQVGPDQPVLIIAEVGVNHNGDLGLAEALIEAAAAAGADAVKFQTFSTDHLVTAEAPQAAYQRQRAGTTGGGSQRSMLAELELPPAAFAQLANKAEELGLLFLSTPFDLPSLALLEALEVPAIKISSGDLTNLPFLKAAAALNRPLILSTGMATLAEVGEAVATIKETGNDRFVLLHCTTAYPAPLPEANLRAMVTMADTFQCLVGYSDHTPGSVAALGATALGAVVLEKHLTLNQDLQGPDHRASLNPYQFAQWVKQVRSLEAALGDGEKIPMPVEAENIRVARKSLVAAVDIAPNTVITEDMITAKRPGTGLAPRWWNYVVGRRARRWIAADQLLHWDDLEPWEE